MVYRGLNDGHIHELWCLAPCSNGWHHNDLSASTGQGPISGDPHGYIFQGTQHIVYRTTDGAIHELRSEGPYWHHSAI